MQIMVTGRHVDVTEAIKNYAREKLDKALRERPHINEVHIIMDVEKYRHLAELSVRGKNLDLFCKEETSDMYASIDRVVDKMERRLRRFRERHSRKHQPPLREEEAAALARADESREEPRILARLLMKPMYLHEALLQMKFDHHLFLAFINAKTDRVNFLSREKGNIITCLIPKRSLRPGRAGTYRLWSYEDDRIVPEKKPRPVKKEKYTIEWMTPDEALASMVAEGGRFRFFLNNVSHTPCVVYQQTGGNYALIEPKW